MVNIALSKHLAVYISEIVSLEEYIKFTTMKQYLNL